MFASVAILRRMPKGLDRLDYRLPNNLSTAPGMVVMVPFRKNIIPAVITGIYPNSSLPENKIKTIDSIVNTEPFISTNQLKFLEEIAEMYQTSLGFILKTNLPPWKKTKIIKLNLKHFSQNKKNKEIYKPILIIPQDEKEAKEKIIDSIDKQKNNLIISPTIERVLAWKKYCEEKNISFTIITSENTEKEIFSLWEKIRNQENGLVIGTRRALFLPWFNLKNIFLEDDGDENHKNWDMAPRFHNRDACLMLSSQHGAKFYTVSISPSPDTYYFAKHNIFEINGKLPILPMPEIINLKEERKNGNYGVWSERLKEVLKNNSGNVFLFLNRRGSAHYVGCRDCGFVAKCDNCKRTLVYHSTENNLVCHFCDVKKNTFVHCPNCQNVSMVMYGAGTELVENEARKNWGNKYKIIRIDADTEFLFGPQSNLPKIIIGTQMAWQKINWEEIKTLVFLDIDTELFQSDYRATENMWHCLRSAGGRIEKDTAFLIQTSHPEHRIFSFLNDPEKFYQTELEERKMLKYPPFTYLVRLWRGFDNLNTYNRGGSEISQKLQSLTKTYPDIIISGPLEMTPFFFQSQYWQAFLVRVPYKFYKKYTKIIANSINPEWKLDPNPTNILSLN